MIIWSVLDLRSLILNRAGRLGLTALHQAQQLRNCFDIGLRLGAVATTCRQPVRPPAPGSARPPTVPRAPTSWLPAPPPACPAARLPTGSGARKPARPPPPSAGFSLAGRRGGVTPGAPGSRRPGSTATRQGLGRSGPPRRARLPNDASAMPAPAARTLLRSERASRLIAAFGARGRGRSRCLRRPGRGRGWRRAGVGPGGPESTSRRPGGLRPGRERAGRGGVGRAPASPRTH